MLNLFSNFSAKKTLFILKYIEETEFPLLKKQGLVPAEHKSYTNHTKLNDKESTLNREEDSSNI